MTTPDGLTAVPLKGATPADRPSRLRGVRWGVAAACGLLTCATVCARPVSYQLDPAHTFVHFEVMHFGTSTIRGRLGPISGEVVLDREAGRGEVSLQVRTGSVDTGLAVFNQRLCAADLLACETEPLAYFVARRLEFDGDRVKAVTGEFTLRGVSRALTLRAERFGCHTHPTLQREVCGGDFVGQVRRSDFGASFGLPFVSDAVTLRVQVEGLRVPAVEAAGSRPAP